MRPNLISRLKEEWNNLDPVDPLRGLIADAIDALAEQPAQQPNEADELIRNLGFDPEQFRTEAGFINHMKLRAAIKHPEEYQASMQP